MIHLNFFEFSGFKKVKTWKPPPLPRKYATDRSYDYGAMKDKNQVLRPIVNIDNHWQYLLDLK